MKKLYWFIISNLGLSVTVKDISTVKEIIENDFKNETENGKIEIDDLDLHYTVKPIMLTQKEYEALQQKNNGIII
ncbi:MAG: hypothetical protein ACK504_10350 [Bacteroidota bacterium]